MELVVDPSDGQSATAHYRPETVSHNHGVHNLDADIPTALVNLHVVMQFHKGESFLTMSLSRCKSNASLCHEEYNDFTYKREIGSYQGPGTSTSIPKPLGTTPQVF